MKIMGFVGLVLIIVGVLRKKDQDWFFLCGGVLLFFYSVSMGDKIFQVLQLIFSVAALRNILRKKEKDGSVVVSKISRMRPSQYGVLFYAACDTIGAKFVCQNKDCRYEKKWSGQIEAPIRCENPSGLCNGVMLLTINEEEGKENG
jgi:hypothetical protein